MRLESIESVVPEPLVLVCQVFSSSFCSTLERGDPQELWLQAIHGPLPPERVRRDPALDDERASIARASRCRVRICRCSQRLTSRLAALRVSRCVPRTSLGRAAWRTSPAEPLPPAPFPHFQALQNSTLSHVLALSKTEIPDWAPLSGRAWSSGGKHEDDGAVERRAIRDCRHEYLPVLLGERPEQLRRLLAGRSPCVRSVRRATGA